MAVFWHFCLQESRARIGAAGALGRALGYLSPTAPPRLQSCALRLVTNLVLERKLRAAAVRYGLVQRLAQLLASLGSGTSFDCGGGGSGSGGTGGGSSSVNSSVSSGGSRSAATGQLHPLVYGCLYLASVEPAGRQALAASELVQRWTASRGHRCTCTRLWLRVGLRGCTHLCCVPAVAALAPQVRVPHDRNRTTGSPSAYCVHRICALCPSSSRSRSTWRASRLQARCHLWLRDTLAAACVLAG